MATAWKDMPKRPRICINWNPSFRPHFLNFQKLWCCGGICHQPDTFIQIGSGHTVKLELKFNFCCHSSRLSRLAPWNRKSEPSLVTNWMWFFWALQVHNMVARVVQFLSGGTKLEIYLSNNQHAQRKLWNFENWCHLEVSKSALIWLSKSICYVKNHRNLSYFFLYWRMSIKEHICCYWHFLLKSIFKAVYY